MLSVGDSCESTPSAGGVADFRDDHSSKNVLKCFVTHSMQHEAPSARTDVGSTNWWRYVHAERLTPMCSLITVDIINDSGLLEMSSNSTATVPCRGRRLLPLRSISSFAFQYVFQSRRLSQSDTAINNKTMDDSFRLGLYWYFLLFRLTCFCVLKS